MSNHPRRKPAASDEVMCMDDIGTDAPEYPAEGPRRRDIEEVDGVPDRTERYRQPLEPLERHGVRHGIP